MYRQVRMRKRDAYYQLIFWRNSEHQPFKTYRLDTVTLGTASATYLAIRTLKRLADGDEVRYPPGAEIIPRDTYVDDVISGTDSLEEATRKRNEIQELLRSAGFNLRTWGSNKEDVLQGISQEQLHGIHRKTCSRTKPFRQKQRKLPSDPLSIIAKLFDRLWWISPCIVHAKMMRQQLSCMLRAATHQHDQCQGGFISRASRKRWNYKGFAIHPSEHMELPCINVC